MFNKAYENYQFTSQRKQYNELSSYVLFSRDWCVVLNVMSNKAYENLSIYVTKETQYNGFSFYVLSKRLFVLRQN